MSEMTTKHPREDPFFIGWLRMPAAYRRFLGPVAAGLLCLAVGGAALVASFQGDPGNGGWESDKVRDFDGLAFTRPYAVLVLPGEEVGNPPRTVLLVEGGKFGALARVEQFVQGNAEGQAVRARGTLLHRDGRWMLELAEGEGGMRRLSAEEQRRLPPLNWPEPVVVAERITLKGEVIDPKCYLGAMEPGGGKTHKACAMLCISGGVPPMLLTRDASKNETFYLLVTRDGEVAGDLVLPFVGEPVSATGRLERRGDLLTLRLDPGGIQR